jgi:hypothetical protein
MFGSHLQEDELRVTSLFHEAAAAGISLSQLSLSWNHLVQLLLGGNCLLLVLVDKCKLEPWLATADACMPYALCGLVGAGDCISLSQHCLPGLSQSAVCNMNGQ